MSPAETKMEAFEVRVFQTLQELAHLLEPGSRTRAALNRLLDILARDYSAVRSALVLRQIGTSAIRIEASHGLSPDEQKAFLRVEGGIIDQVLNTGKAMVVQKAAGGALFPRPDGTHPINRIPGRTYICVPIGPAPAQSGALLVEVEQGGYRDINLMRTFLEVLASMAGQALRATDLLGEKQRPAEKHAGSEKHPTPLEGVRTIEQIRDQFDFSNLVGNSGTMQRVYEQIAKVAPSNATVMIRGESGTGKELIAQAIHANSPRRDGPFIKVNCAALPDALIESELFGYEKGAFTGAQNQKKGRFELAEGGTLFLDEIGEINAATAVKLLRVLQEREFERLGGTRTVKADVRLIVATNKDLEKAIAAGVFREDLFYRLNVFTVFLPPLRERKPDVLMLADHFLEVFNNAHGRNVKRISTPAIDMLMSYHWPGNVRELANTIERAVLICDDQVIHSYHLPPTLQTAEATGTVLNIPLKDAVETYEKELIQDTLKTTRGNRAQAAKLLHTTERIINYKAKKYNIDCARFK